MQSLHFQQFNPPSNVIDMVKLGSKITLDFVYSYFMGSDDESQRIKLIESFVRACLEVMMTVQFLWNQGYTFL